MGEEIDVLVADRRLVADAVRTVWPSRKMPRWVAVMDIFCVGSTTASRLCRREGLKPDEQVGGPRRRVR